MIKEKKLYSIRLFDQSFNFCIGEKDGEPYLCSTCQTYPCRLHNFVVYPAPKDLPNMSDKTRIKLEALATKQYKREMDQKRRPFFDKKNGRISCKEKDGQLVKNCDDCSKRYKCILKEKVLEEMLSGRIADKHAAPDRIYARLSQPAT